MIELIVGTYGVVCWLVFKKFKLVPVTTYTVCTAILVGIIFLLGLAIVLSLCHPASHDGRLYSTITQLVPQVRGKVVAVPVKSNEPLKAGDILFEIESRPYQLEVERLEAVLASMEAKAEQLAARLVTAQAATEVARSNLLVSESENDRQARIALQSAQAQIVQTQSRLTLANASLARSRELQGSGAVSREELDVDIAKVGSLEAELSQAQSAERSAQETLESGGARLKAAQDELKRAEAMEHEAQIALDAESGGMNPEVRQAIADLEGKRWELEQTTVRAPSDGYVTHVTLRPGQMATPFSAGSSMLFVPSEKQWLVATFAQTAAVGLEPGLEAEIAFKAYPGQIFRAKVARILPINPEGQLIVNGQLQTATAASAPGNVAVAFEYGDDVVALKLPSGAQASIAVYTHHFHALAIVRKLILRIKSWENYLFFMQGLNALH